MKKFLSLLLVTVMIATTLLGCSSKTDKPATTPTGAVTAAPTGAATAAPTQAEKPTIKILTTDAAEATISTANAPVWKFIGDKLGMNIEVESYSADDIATKLSLIMASDDRPDIYWQCGLTDGDVQSFGEQGILLSMDDYVASGEYKNITDWFAQTNAYGDAVSANGHLYTLPSLSAKNNYSTYMSINTKWMQNLGITEYPKTLDELYTVLCEFRDKDANGNGDPSDEIPLEGSPTRANTLAYFLQATGVNVFWPWVGGRIDTDANGKAYAVATDERYKYVVKYIAKLVKEGLLDASEETMTDDEVNAIRYDDRFGVLSGTNWEDNNLYARANYYTFTPLTSQYISTPEVTAVDGYQAAMASIDASSKNPEACMKFLDYCISPDGSALFSCLDETVNATGISDDVLNFIKSCGTTNDKDVYGQYGCRWIRSDWAVNITAETDNITYTKNLNYADNNVKTPEYQLKLSAEAQKVKDEVYTDLDTYIQEQTARWILGEADIDKEWDAYVAQCNKMGYQDLVAAYQPAYDEYFKK